jgi:hypothetical protein
MKSLPVHMLWAVGNLSRLARLSLASFLRHGYRVTLWSYEPDAHSMAGVGVRDAAELVPEGRDGNCSMDYLSSLFRYRVLADRGGMWADMDVVALVDSPDIEATPLVASEKRRPFRYVEPSATGETLTQVTNCLMANPKPKPGDLWHRAADCVASLSEADRTWENMGPHLLTKLMLEDPGHGVAVLPPEAVNPASWWNVPTYFLDEREPPPSPFMHMYASIWAKRGVDAEAPFPANSLAGKLWRRYGL